MEYEEVVKIVSERTAALNRLNSFAILLTEIDSGIHEQFNFEFRFAEEIREVDQSTLNKFMEMFEKHPAIRHGFVVVERNFYEPYSKVPRGKGSQTTYCPLMVVRSKLTDKGKRKLKELKKASDSMIEYDIDTNRFEIDKALEISETYFKYLSNNDETAPYFGVLRTHLIAIAGYSNSEKFKKVKEWAVLIKMQSS